MNSEEDFQHCLIKMICFVDAHCVYANVLWLNMFLCYKLWSIVLKSIKVLTCLKALIFCLPFMWSGMAQVPFASFTKEEMQVSQRLKNLLKVKDW